MMKRLFSFLILAVVCSAAAFAQTSLVATLKHGSTISEFYGGDALVEAYSAAQSGDVITLSSGTFKAVNIAKAITVRGAGMAETIIDGDFTITGSGSFRTALEGCQCLNVVQIYGRDMGDGLDDILLMKNLFYTLGFQGGTINVIHCFVNKFYSKNVSDEDPNTSVSCYNCVLQTDNYSYHLNTFYLFQNCIFPGMGLGNIHNSRFINSIYSYDIPTDNTVEYCAFRNASSFQNSHNVPGGDINLLASGNWQITNPQNTFELSEEAKAIFIGSDGKEMGIYGGNFPFDPTPSNPQVKKFNVSTTNTDGKLNVKINVE